MSDAGLVLGLVAAAIILIGLGVWLDAGRRRRADRLEPPDHSGGG